MSTDDHAMSTPRQAPAGGDRGDPEPGWKPSFEPGGEASISIGNEFAEVRLARVTTRNGSRLLISSPRTGQWITLCPLAVEALTWQNTATFSAMVGNPGGPLLDDEPGDLDEAGGG